MFNREYILQLLKVYYSDKDFYVKLPQEELVDLELVLNRANGLGLFDSPSDYQDFSVLYHFHTENHWALKSLLICDSDEAFKIMYNTHINKVSKHHELTRYYYDIIKNSKKD